MTKSFSKKTCDSEQNAHADSCCCKKSTKSPESKCCGACRKSKAKPTEIIVEYDVGFGNTMFIRGNTCDLYWDKGIAMENIGNNIWKWETTSKCNDIEFKLLINDETWSEGENFTATAYSQNYITPKF